MIRHYLASANTGKNFICKFDQILDHSKPEFMYIIKGGSGTGKSTLMKRVGRYFEELQEDVEYFYCSSDNKSLDGVRIKNLNLAIIDGTAPHITETKMLGIKDTIVNVGKFVKPDIKNFEVKVKKIMDKKTKYFTLLNNYLTSAFDILENQLQIFKNEVRNNFVKQTLDKIIKDLGLVKQNVKCVKRELFINSLDENFVLKNDYKREITLNSNIWENHLTLEKLHNYLMKNNYKFIVFKNIINTEIIDGIEIENINTIILNKPKNIVTNKKLNEFVKSNDEVISMLLILAKNCLICARKNHLKLEEIYIKNMDFEKLNDTFNWLIGDMLQKS